MTRALLAALISLGMHALGYAIVSGAPAPSPSVARPRAVERAVEIDVAPLGQARAVPAPVKRASASAPAAPPRRRRRAVSHPVAPAVVQTAAVASEVAVEPPAPRLPPPFDSTEGEAASDARPTPGPAGPADQGVDLGLLFDRLQASAHHCLGNRRGHVRARFCVSSSGAPTDISVLQSSGSMVLDQAVRSCVIPGAAPLPPLDRCVVVPVSFP